MDCEEPPFNYEFQFDTDTLRGGFSLAQLRSAYVVRYRDSAFTRPLDTVRVPLSGQVAVADSVYLTKLRVFENASFILNISYHERDTIAAYRAQVPAVGARFDLTAFVIRGLPAADKCECGGSTRFVRVNGQSREITGYNPVMLTR